MPDLTIPIADRFASESDGITRQEAIRRIVKDWLIGHGYLKD